MKKSTMRMRQAIAMIELIFAIVVMGIVMMSAPQLVSTASQSGYASTQQEAINEASSQMLIIMGHHWDENNTQGDFKPIVLATTNGNVGLNEVPATNRRSGTSMQSHRAFVSTTGDRANASTNLVWEEAEIAGAVRDDMDDFNGVTNLIQLGGATTADNIQRGNDITITRIVQYNVDNVGTYDTANLAFTPFALLAGVGQSADIKEIVVTITSTDAGAANEVTELAKTITLRAFACNIGSYKLEERQ